MTFQLDGNIGFDLHHAKSIIAGTYGRTVSFNEKDKSLLKFGTHTSVGTGWETLAEMQDSETEETFVAGNDITTVASTASGDAGKTLKFEYHIINSDGTTTFGVQDVTLDGSDGTTPVTLSVPAFRAGRAYNSGNTALTGNIAFYEGGADTAGKPDDDSQVHLLIPAGEQQTQKAATTISGQDFWVITNISLSVTEKTSAWAEARIEVKPIASAVWRPTTQNFSSSDASGTVQINKKPLIIVPSDHDVRIAVRTNTAGVSVSGGMNGYLASVIS